MAEPLTIATVLKYAASPFIKMGEALFSGFQKRNQQPTLSIRLSFNNSSRTTQGISANNVFPPEGEAINVADLGNMNHFYNLGWTYEMSITNDSEFAAYQLFIIEHHGVQLNFNPTFDYTKPILPNETVKYELKAFHYYFEGTYTQADELMKQGPIEVFRIEYTNVKKKVKFFTELRPRVDIRERNTYGKA